MAWYSVIWCGSVSYDVVWYLLLYDVVWFGMMYSYVLPNDEAWYDWVHGILYHLMSQSLVLEIACLFLTPPTQSVTPHSYSIFHSYSICHFSFLLSLSLLLLKLSLLTPTQSVTPHSYSVCHSSLLPIYSY